MQSKPKSNSVITHTVAEDFSAVTFAVLGAGQFTFDVRAALGASAGDGADVGAMWDAMPTFARRAVIHGVIQRISDRAAIGRDPETGASATPQDKFDAMRELADHMQSTGEWNLPRATGTAAPKGGVLLTALCRLFPAKPRDEVKTWLAAKSAAERTALRKSEAVARIITEIEAAAGKGVDGDALLGELNG